VAFTGEGHQFRDALAVRLGFQLGSDRPVAHDQQPVLVVQ
jgi:hypothetical protein